MKANALAMAAVLVVGCGGNPEHHTPTGGLASIGPEAEASSGAPDGDSDDATTGSTADTGDPGESSGGGSESGEPATTGAPPLDDALGLPALGSLVIMGDSIGDGGGQAPYYYDLLRASLQAHYGPLTYHNVAHGGSETDSLLGQSMNIPDELPGPVVVVITSGGNDMKSQIAAIIGGTDGPARETMQGNISAALDLLLTPGRFGEGVEVFVVEANIYDSSDGAGNFGQNDCAFGGGLPPIMTDGFFAAWNGAIGETVDAHGQTLLDMHGHFYGHGFNGEENWYASDCTHPNAVGHDALHQLVYRVVTGG